MKMTQRDRWYLDEDGKRVSKAERFKPRNHAEWIERARARRKKFEALCAKYGKKPATVEARMKGRRNAKPMTLREALRLPLIPRGKKGGDDWRKTNKFLRYGKVYKN